MNWRVVILALAAFAGVEASRTILEPGVTVFEHTHWNKGPRVTAQDTIEVRFVMKSCPMKRAKLEEMFWSVSDPASLQYKKYLSLPEVADLLHPLPEEGSGDLGAAEVVRRHLLEQPGLVAGGEGMVKITKTRDIVTATLNAQAAEGYFATELHHFAATSTWHAGKSLVRAAAAYSVPSALVGKVALVDKLLRLPRLEDPKVGRGHEAAGGDPEFDSCGVAECKGATTPQVLRKRYGFPSNKTSYTEGNGMCCTEFQLQGLDKKDLKSFGAKCGVEHVKVDSSTGLGGNLIPGVEALLDVEYIEAVAAPIPLSVINSISYSLVDWAAQLNDDDNPAPVQSVSYGNDEVQQESAEYMYECNTQFMQTGLRGLSVLFASGDQGVWGRTGRDGTGEFHPDFPAGSPYVTSVGGTDFAVPSQVGEETAWANGGGGFSNTFAAPAYQSNATLAYLASGVALPDASAFNATGRGYPDVSALAGEQNGYCVAAKGRFLKVGGTSAACPVFAGAVALINDELLAQGKAPMGFLNPWIYGVAAPNGAFFDVTSGNNNGGFGEGFTATTGWDPATGFGTPNYETMRDLALNSAV